LHPYHNVQHIPVPFPSLPSHIATKHQQQTQKNSPLPRSTSCIPNQEVSSWIQFSSSSSLFREGKNEEKKVMDKIKTRRSLSTTAYRHFFQDCFFGRNLPFGTDIFLSFFSSLIIESTYLYILMWTLSTVFFSSYRVYLPICLACKEVSEPNYDSYRRVCLHATFPSSAYKRAVAHIVISVLPKASD
jgi:hypothetical protein